MNTTPVILVCYNRPHHTAEMLKALEVHNIQNLIIFADAPKSDKDVEGVRATRKLLEGIRWTHPEIVFQTENQGLAKSIVSSANYAFSLHDRLVLLEDDCVPQRHFFDFMSNCLDRYEENEKIFGISGYTVPIPSRLQEQHPYDLYFYPRIGSWGWGTWKRAWQHYDTDLVKLCRKALESNIDLTQGGVDIPVNIEGLLRGTLKDVWTLNWVLTVYLNKGYYIYPTKSHINNIGFDGTGVHCGKSDLFQTILADSPAIRFPSDVVLNYDLISHYNMYFGGPVVTPPPREPAGLNAVPEAASRKAPLNVALLSTMDFGGAGKATHRLLRGLQAYGSDALMAVLCKSTEDPSIKLLSNSAGGLTTVSAEGAGRWEELFRKWRGQLAGYTNRPEGLEIFTDSRSRFSLEDIPELQRADILNFHWMAGLLNYPTSSSALKGKKIVWTLHDMNPFTGGCHYAGECTGYLRSCGTCPQLGSSDKEDLSRKIWEDKRAAYADLDLTIVTPSRWLAECARNSSLLSRFPVHVIPNGLPTDIFRPHPKDELRRSFNIPEHARVILFGADYDTRRKGFHYLVDALRALPDKRNLVLASFGPLPETKFSSEFLTMNFGSISNETRLAQIYSLADLFVLPSMEDNLPNTVIESMACGIPVVGFKIGGMPDMIEHKVNGYLAQPGDVTGLTEGIRWCLANASALKLGERCREKVELEYSQRVQAESYTNLYENILLGKSAVKSLAAPACSADSILIAANLVPFRDAGQRQRQDTGIASITALVAKGIIPLNICYPDELLEPADWQTATMLERSANVELKIDGKRKPFVIDLFDIAAQWATAHGITWFAITNSDIVLTDALIAELRRLQADGIETVAISRNEVERVEGDGRLVPGYLEVNGYDIFLCRSSWWQSNRHRFQPYIYGERAWDDAYAAIMACHSRFAMLYQDGLCFHFKHPTSWISGPYSDYNMGLYTGIDKPYSDRYEAFIKEVLALTKAQLTPAKTAELVAKHFSPPPPVPVNSSQGFVNIGMITYNRLDFTKLCLEAFERTVDYPHRLTVIDNNSQDGTVEFLRKLQAQGVIHNLILLNENVGVAKASNLAWAMEPDAPYYMKLDNDIVFQKMGWLSRLVEVIERVPQIGAAGYNFEPVSYPLYELNGCQVRIKEPGNLGGACILIPKRTERLLGNWCEDYGLYGEEDADYGFRIRCAGLLNAYMEDEEIGFHLPAGKAATIDSATLVALDGQEEDLHADYRKWKDELRRKNVHGPFKRNLERYAHDPTSLFQQSRFATEWLRTHRPDIDVSPLKTTGGKLTITLLSLDLPSHACMQLRITGPASAFSDEVELLQAVTNDGTKYLINSDSIDRADLIIVQRFFPRPETERHLQKALASGKPIIYEFDDLLTDHSPDNPHRELSTLCAPFVSALLAKADGVTVSTDLLASALLPRKGTVHVLPNLLDEKLWAAPPASRPTGAPVIIGYAGTPGHEADLAPIEEALERIARMYGHRVAFRFFGCATERIRKLPGYTFIPFTGNYSEYAATLQNSGIDIGLVPLEDNRFNRCKSNIKWLEYSACGIAGIYADLPPYRSCVKEGETGLLIAGYDVDAWVAAIESLIDNPARRHAMALAARTEVLANYTLKSRGHLFLDTWRRIAGRADTTAKEQQMPISPQPFAPVAAATGSDAPKVSIIVPLYNKAEYTKQCLEALALNTEQALNYEVILVDNASSDGTAEYLRTLSGDVTIVTNLKNLGFAKACNQGGRIARGRYLVFLNNDTIPHPGWLDGLIKGAEQDGADIVGARLLYPNGRVQHAGVAFNEQSIGYHIFNGFPADSPAVNRKRFMQCVTAACMLVKQELFAELGGFDEGYVNGFEDVDFCLRAGERGRRILYTPESVLIHFEETSEGRKDHDTPNIRRFLARWEGKVRCDHQDIYRSEGYRAERQADGRLRIYQADVAPVSSAPTAPQQVTPTPGTGAAAATPSVSGREKALALKAEGRYVEAIEHLVKIVTAGDNSVLVDLGDCLASLEKYDDALALYEESLALCPTNGRALVGVGVVRYMTRRIAEAADAFSRALETDPADPKALCGLGMARCAQGRNAEGFELYGRALEAEPENLTAVHESVRLAYELGRFSEAAKRLESYLRHHPGDIDILFASAGLLHMAGRNAEARDALERLLVFSPDYSGAMELLAKLEEQDQEPGERATEAEARRLKEDGKYEEALTAFSRVAEAGDSSALADMGDCLAQLGRLDEAAARYLEALDADGANLKALVGLGVVSLVQGKQVKAVTWFNRALKADPANAKALCGLGMVRNMQNKHDEAFSLLARAVDADPEGLTALHELIRLSYATGRFDEAGERLDRYLMHHPADLDMVFAQAGIRFKAGRYAEALSSIETVLLFASDYEGGLELREAITQAM